ncbi:hypothetical protein HDU96_001976 [Phlyctochytrium bullatum]|nr:hypothetical protein HDU96_001976 [Phlyctochytrium bullatum]
MSPAAGSAYHGMLEFPRSRTPSTMIGLLLVLASWMRTTEATPSPSAASSVLLESPIALDMSYQVVWNPPASLSSVTVDRAKGVSAIAGLELLNRNLAKIELDGVLMRPCDTNFTFTPTTLTYLGTKDAIGFVDSLDAIATCRPDQLPNLKFLILPTRAIPNTSLTLPAPLTAALGRLPDDQFSVLSTFAYSFSQNVFNTPAVALGLIQVPRVQTTTPGSSSVDWKWAFTIPVLIFLASMLIAYLVHRVRMKEMQRGRAEFEHAMAEHLVALLSNIRDDSSSRGAGAGGGADVAGNSAAVALFGPPRPLLMAPKDIAKLKTFVFDGDPASLNSHKRDGGAADRDPAAETKPRSQAGSRADTDDGTDGDDAGKHLQVFVGDKPLPAPHEAMEDVPARPDDARATAPRRKSDTAPATDPTRLMAGTHAREAGATRTLRAYRSSDAVLSSLSARTMPLPLSHQASRGGIGRQVSQASLSSSMTVSMHVPPGFAVSPSSPRLVEDGLLEALDARRGGSPVPTAGGGDVKGLKPTKSHASLHSFASDAVTALTMHSLLVSEELQRRRRVRTHGGAPRSKSVGPDGRRGDRVGAGGERGGADVVPATRAGATATSAATRAAAASAIVLHVFPADDEVVSEEEDEGEAGAAAATTGDAVAGGGEVRAMQGCYLQRTQSLPNRRFGSGMYATEKYVPAAPKDVVVVTEKEAPLMPTRRPVEFELYDDRDHVVAEPAMRDAEGGAGGKPGGDDEEDEPPVCSICICPYEKGDVLVPLSFCSHVYHSECLLPWLTQTSATCPLCRAHVLDEPTRRRRELRRQRRRLRQLLESGELGLPPVAVSPGVGEVGGAAGAGGEEGGSWIARMRARSRRSRHDQGFLTALGEVLRALEEEEERENEERRRRRRERRARREGRGGVPDAIPEGFSPVDETPGSVPMSPARSSVGDRGLPPVPAGAAMPTAVAVSSNARETRRGVGAFRAWFGRRAAGTTEQDVALARSEPVSP